MNIFARVIYIARLERGFSQKELAVKAGVPQPNISNIEKGRDFKVSTLMNIASALDIPVDVLIRGRQLPDINKKQLFQRENIEKAISCVVNNEKAPEKLRTAVALISSIAGKSKKGYISKKVAHLSWYHLKQSFSEQEINMILSRINKARSRPN